MPAGVIVVPAQAVSLPDGVGVLDVISLGLTVLGLILTVAGFWVAIYQIRRTRTAAEAAVNAAVIGSARMRYNQLLLLVPQMEHLEGEMDSAIKQNDAYGAERVLLRWRQIANLAHGVLSEMGTDYTVVVNAIDKARGTAIRVKGRLSELDTQVTTVGSITRGVRKEMSVVNDRLGSVAGKLGTDLTTEESA